MVTLHPVEPIEEKKVDITYPLQPLFEQIILEIGRTMFEQYKPVDNKFIIALHGETLNKKINTYHLTQVCYFAKDKNIGLINAGGSPFSVVKDLESSLLFELEKENCIGFLDNGLNPIKLDAVRKKIISKYGGIRRIDVAAFGKNIPMHYLFK